MTKFSNKLKKKKHFCDKKTFFKKSGLTHTVNRPLTHSF